MLSRIIGLLLLMTAVAIGVGAGYLHYSWKNASPRKRLLVLWQRDIQRLKAEHKLPKAWNQIKEIKLETGTPLAKKWATDLIPPIRTHRNGHYRLEILLLSWTEDSDLGAIVQYDLVDLKSGNTTWELGRTFTLAKLRKKTSATTSSSFTARPSAHSTSKPQIKDNSPKHLGEPQRGENSRVPRHSNGHAS